MVTNLLQLFRPGDVIHGFCNGYFGRDDYETKTCVAVTRRYALFEYEDGRATVMNQHDNQPSAEMVAKWKIPESHD